MKFYVYELRTEGVVFYVGKGTGTRMWTHRHRANSGFRGQSTLYARLRTILSGGGDFTAVKVYQTDDEWAALAEEQRLIDAYGEALVNRAIAQGTTTRLKESSKALMRTARRAYFERNLLLYGQKLPPEVVKKIAASHRGTKRSCVTKLRMSRARAGVALSSEHRESLKGVRPHTRGPKPEKRVPNLKLKGVPKSDEHRAKLAAAQTGRRLKRSDGATYSSLKQAARASGSTPANVRSAANRGGKANGFAFAFTA